MDESLSIKRLVGFRSDYNESLVECSCCQGSLRDPVMLKCLHHCCRSCITLSATERHTLPLSSSVHCPVCGTATEKSAVMSNALLCTYQRLSSLSSAEVYCNTCDAQGVSAVYWCADCCLGVCESCYSWHNRFHRRHRSAELDVARTWSLSQLTPVAQCDMHKKQMDMQCFTCRGPKCPLCYQSCRATMHDLQSLSHDTSRQYASRVIGAINVNRERLCRAVSSLQQKCQEVRGRLRRARVKDGSRMLFQNKRSLHDATIKAFDTSVGQVCVNLERIRCICTTFLGRRVVLYETVLLARRNIEMLSVERLEMLKVRHVSLVLKKIACRCTAKLRVSLQQHRTYWQENVAFSINGSLPLTSDIVLRTCLGATDRRRAAPPAPLLFGHVSVTFETPVDCSDMAVTRDGHVLLAAAEHGLLVYSDHGQQLVSWRPARLNNGLDDRVYCVAALSDGPVAVGVAFAQHVVLLRLSQTGDTWLQDCCVALLQSPPWRLAVHGDLLAVAEWRLNEQRRGWVEGREVKLLRMSSGQVLYTQSRDHEIGSVALTALCVVTRSRSPVTRSSGATPYVLEAFSHSGEFLWRYEAIVESLDGLCVSPDCWSQVYVAVAKRDRSSRRVIAIGGADGKARRDVMSSMTHGLQSAAHLSLSRGQQRTVLAVLSRDRGGLQYRIVSLYQAKTG